jgi:transcriptional regulator with XRE-family HTH domain
MESHQRIARQVGSALRRLRLKRRETWRQVAAAAGIPTAALAAYERGRQLPDLATLGLLLAALGVTADEFGRYLGPWGGVEPRVTFVIHIHR